jgi:Asp-tRNA(Asn)/Glu-tRNA(Gln) amidotransferase A subunit family amidase
MRELLDQPIASAAELYAQRSVSVTELVDAVLEQADQTEPRVHAFAHVDHEGARAAARVLDEELRDGRSRGPLHGIPVGVKDLCATTDMPTEAGSRVLRGHTADEDATVVRRLRDAGAVLIGKTVTHEFAYGQNIPDTRSPWVEAESYPGGSSAGSGVAVAVRSAYAGIGTDTGGSIRIPASLNNVVGLKPTFGRVSRSGVIQMSPSLDHVGPLTRTVADCAAVHAAISGYDPTDRTSIDVPVDPVGELEESLDGHVVGIERNYFLNDAVQPYVVQAVERAAEHLASMGAEVVEVSLPELELMPVVALTILLADTSAYHRRTMRSESRADYEPGTRLMLELGELVPATQYVTAQRARTQLCGAMQRLFDEQRLDALLAPTTPMATKPFSELSVGLVQEEDKTTLAEYVHTCFPANLTGQPALSVPGGFSDEGRPFGIQLMGRPFGESTLFRIGHAYEQLDRHYEQLPPFAAATDPVR